MRFLCEYAWNGSSSGGIIITSARFAFYSSLLWMTIEISIISKSGSDFCTLNILFPLSLLTPAGGGGGK
jgi:hypothetical protein